MLLAVNKGLKTTKTLSNTTARVTPQRHGHSRSHANAVLVFVAALLIIAPKRNSPNTLHPRDG